jgi:trehalose-6-phosphate synthase
MRAVQTDRSESARRIGAMRRYLRDHGGRQWASDFLAALATDEAPIGETA